MCPNINVNMVSPAQANYPILCCGVCALDNTKVTYFDRSLGNCEYALPHVTCCVAHAATGIPMLP